MGGEWGGSVLLSMEWGSAGRRGFMASWPQMGVPLGLLLSTLLVQVTSAATGPDFETWGWRVPFLVSLLLVGVGLYVRLRVLESPEFAAVRESRGRRQAATDGGAAHAVAGGAGLGLRATLGAGAVLPVHHVRADLRHEAARAQP